MVKHGFLLQRPFSGGHEHVLTTFDAREIDPAPLGLRCTMKTFSLIMKGGGKSDNWS